MDHRILLHVRLLEDLTKWYGIHVRPESTVAEFKYMIAVLANVPVYQQTLIHVNECLEDDRTIASYGLVNGCSVYLFRTYGPSAFFGSTSFAASALARRVGNSTPVSGSVQNQGFEGQGSASLSPRLDGIALGDIYALRRTHTIEGSSNGTLPEILINVQYSSEPRFSIRARPDLTVLEIKGLINVEQNIPVAEQQLIFSGQFLLDDRTIGSYGVEDGFVIHLARRSLPADAVPPEELYEEQLSLLQWMGFNDTHENIQALIETSGNVHAAVVLILQNR